MLETQQLREAHHLKIWFLLPGQRLQLKMRCLFGCWIGLNLPRIGVYGWHNLPYPRQWWTCQHPIQAENWWSGVVCAGWREQKKLKVIRRKVTGYPQEWKITGTGCLEWEASRRCLRGDLVPIFVAQLYQLQRSPAVASKTPGSLEPLRCEVPIAIHCRYEALNLTCQGASTGRDPFWEFFLVTLSRVKTWPLFGGSIRVTWKKLVVEFKYAILQYSNHSNCNPPF